MYELVGYRYVDMVSEGEKIQGWSCFFLYHEDQEGLTGCEAFKQFLPMAKFSDFEPDLHRNYQLIYNQKKKLTGIIALDG